MPTFRLSGKLCLIWLMLSTLAHGQSVSDLQYLDQQLALARQLNATAHWRSGRSILEDIEPQLARSSSRQRDLYELTLAHNLALGGAPAAGLELIEQVLTRQPEPDLRLHGLWLAANFATVERSYQRAFAYVRNGMALLDQVDDLGARAGLLGVAGILYARAGELDQGIDMARRAMAYAEQVPPDYPDSSRCIAGQRLADALSLGEDRDATLQAARQALRFCEEERNGHFQGALETMIGRIHLLKGHFDLARQWLIQARDRQIEIGHRNGLMISRLYLAELAVAEGSQQPTMNELDELTTHFRDRRDWNRKAQAHRLAAAQAEAAGDPALAIEHLKLEAVAMERFHAWDRSRRMAYLDVRFDMDNRRRELALLQEQARASELEQETIDQQRSLKLVMQAGAGGMIVLLALMLFRTTRERRHFRTLSLCDSLTELLNHTSFFDQADQALNESLAAGQPYTLVVGDIDHFKRVNDTHGHLAGDQVLCRVASRMRELFPPPAILGRVGGEEFAFALPGEPIRRARDRCERLRERITLARSDDRVPAVTMSFGLAEFNGSETIEQLRRRADQALYEAKKTGRDRLVVAQDRSESA